MWALFGCIFQRSHIQHCSVFQLQFSDPRLEAMGKDIKTCHVVWDLTNNIDWSYWKHESYYQKMPCLLRGHVYWMVSKGRLVLSSAVCAKIEMNWVSFWIVAFAFFKISCGFEAVCLGKSCSSWDMGSRRWRLQGYRGQNKNAWPCLGFSWIFRFWFGLRVSTFKSLTQTQILTLEFSSSAADD